MAGVPASPDTVASEILALEVAIARRDWTEIPGGIDGLLHPDFLEFGSSGRTWDRAEIVAALATAGSNGMSVEAFEAHRLAADVVLATYRTVEIASGSEPRRRLRSSLWVRTGDRWLLRFHQGTPTTT